MFTPLHSQIRNGQVQAAFDQDAQGVLAGRGEPILFPFVERLFDVVLLFLVRLFLGFFLVVLLGSFLFFFY